jgi:hypothetical protein
MGHNPLSADKRCLQQFAPLHSCSKSNRTNERARSARSCLMLPVAAFHSSGERPKEASHRPITPAALSPELPGITLARLYIKPPSCYRVGRPTDDPVVRDHVTVVTHRCNRRSNVAPTKTLGGRRHVDRFRPSCPGEGRLRRRCTDVEGKVSLSQQNVQLS